MPIRRMRYSRRWGCSEPAEKQRNSSLETLNPVMYRNSAHGFNRGHGAEPPERVSPDVGWVEGLREANKEAERVTQKDPAHHNGERGRHGYSTGLFFVSFSAKTSRTSRISSRTSGLRSKRMSISIRFTGFTSSDRSVWTPP